MLLALEMNDSVLAQVFLVDLPTFFLEEEKKKIRSIGKCFATEHAYGPINRKVNIDWRIDFCFSKERKPEQLNLTFDSDEKQTVPDELRQ